tara:strand:- start:3845 stop:4747 length:903 start_codon:yes stop_codon:yes gene_type:complete
LATHNFIVTGGCGFIGSHLVEALVLHGQNVLVVDDCSKGHHKIEHKSVKYLHQEVQRVLPTGTFDAIFHLAATPRIRLSQKDPFNSITNNISSTTAVCEWARRMKIPLFFAASSSTQFLDKMQNPYTFSKSVGEDVLELYRELYGINYHMLHFYNVYGPREADYGEYSTAVRAFKKCVESGEPIRVFGSGKKERDFTHVYDVIDGIMQLMTEKSKPQHVHLGAGNPKTVLEVAKAFDHPIVHEFDKRGEAEKTFCEKPFYKCEYDVVKYCKDWKEDFLQKKTVEGIKEIEEKYAKIDSGQ